MKTKRLFLDMDGTLARFHDQANYLERMFEKDFFLDLEPFAHMLEGVRLFMRTNPDVEVYILSAKVQGEPPYCEGEKHAWLDRYLPEIPRERRILTEMGRPKADYIPGGLTHNDYLLDDYNKGLNQWMYDGGSAIKCHNNINQRGLGAHGGQRGNLWVGAMVHVDDHPALIAAELASHLGLSYDLTPVAAPYAALGPDKLLRSRPGGSYVATQTIDDEVFEAQFVDPLNALRWLAGKYEFEEIQLSLAGEVLSVPVFRLNAICSNIYHDPDFRSFMALDPVQLTADVKNALSLSKGPVVGSTTQTHTAPAVKPGLDSIIQNAAQGHPRTGGPHAVQGRGPSDRDMH